MDPPSGRVPEQGPDLFFVATEACGGGTPDLGFFSGVSVFIGIFGVDLTSGRSTESPRGRGHPPPSWGPWDSPPVTLRSSIFYIFPEKISIDFQRIPRTFISAQKHHHGSSAKNSVSPC